MNRDCDIGSATDIFGTMSLHYAVEVLEKFGIQVRDADYNYRALPDILDEVSRVWTRIVPSASNKLSEAVQCLIDSFKHIDTSEQDDTALDDFLRQFERRDEDASAGKL